MRLLKFRLVPSGSSASSPSSIFLLFIVLSFCIISFSSATTSKGSSSSTSSSKSSKSQSNHPEKIKNFNPIDEAKARQSKRHQKRFHPISLNETENANTNSNNKSKVSNKNVPVLVFPTPSHSWKGSNDDVWPSAAATADILRTTAATKNTTNYNGKTNKKSKTSTNKPAKKEVTKTKVSIKPTDISHFTYSDIRANAGLSVPTPTNITVRSSSSSQTRFVSTNKRPEIKVSKSISSSSSSSSANDIPFKQDYPLPNHFRTNNNNVHEILKVDHTKNLPIAPSPFRNEVIYPPPAPYPFPVPVPPRVHLSPYGSSPFPDFKWAGFDFGNHYNRETARGVSSQVGSGVRHKGTFNSRPLIISPSSTASIAVVEIDSSEKLGSSSVETYSSPTTITHLDANNDIIVGGPKPKTKIKAYGSNKQSSHEKHYNKEKQREKHKEKDNEEHSSQEKHFYGEPNLPKHAYVSTAGLSPGVDPGPGLLPYFESTATHYHLEPPSPLQMKKKSTPDGLVPLDKRIVYVTMVFSWLFWVVTFATYFHWGEKFGHPVPGKPGFYFNHPIIFTVPPDGSKPYFHRRRRSIEGTLSGGKWNFTRVLEMIDIAQKTYEGFDWQSLDCQKKVLCEVSHKNGDLGETGRKITSSINYYTAASDRFIDALEGLPIPQMIQYYLKQYKEAITVGKQANKDCAQSYPTCKFSLKQLFVNKSIKKSA